MLKREVQKYALIYRRVPLFERMGQLRRATPSKWTERGPSSASRVAAVSVGRFLPSPRLLNKGPRGPRRAPSSRRFAAIRGQIVLRKAVCLDGGGTAGTDVRTATAPTATTTAAAPV